MIKRLCLVTGLLFSGTFLLDNPEDDHQNETNLLNKSKANGEDSFDNRLAQLQLSGDSRYELYSQCVSIVTDLYKERFASYEAGLEEMGMTTLSKSLQKTLIDEANGTLSENFSKCHKAFKGEALNFEAHQNMQQAKETEPQAFMKKYSI